MNPITFNDFFARAIKVHPMPKTIGGMFDGWQVAPLFDYETTYDKEVALTPQGVGLLDLLTMPWPFDCFRLAMIERDVPHDEHNPQSAKGDYTTHIVARRVAAELHMMIWWRSFRGSPDDIMVHLYTRADDTDFGDASLYSPKRGWLRNINVNAVSQIAQSAVASFGSFLEDSMLPTNQLVQVRPCRGNHSIHWQQARAHYTFITHGHPANRKDVAAGARIAANHSEELTRAAHNRKSHKRTLRAARFTFARGKTITVKAAWVGPKEWMDAGGKQIYKILEPVDAI